MLLKSSIFVNRDPEEDPQYIRPLSARAPLYGVDPGRIPQGY